MSDVDVSDKIRSRVDNSLREELRLFDSNLDHYLWQGRVTPLPSESESQILWMIDKLAAYQKMQISDAQILLTDEKIYVWGHKVKGTLVASIVSREYEQRRHLSGFDPLRRKDRDSGLLPFTKTGFGFIHRDVEHIEVITFGSRYSLYFFTSEASPLFRINDVTEEELQEIKQLYRTIGVELKYGEFILPLRDIVLFCAIATILLVIGLLAIALIF